VAPRRYDDGKEIAMNAAEWNILGLFRRYLIRPSEIMFVNAHDCRVAEDHFASAILGLVKKGLLVKERPRQAYSLTHAGYRLSRLPQSKSSFVTTAK
jgi:hypothetical protein